MDKPTIIVVTGVSGAGKTAAVNALERRALPHIRCFYFDHIGVPSSEIMDRDFGGPEGWQLDATRRWISKLVDPSYAGSQCVLDGQTRPSFVRLALASYVGVRAQIVLFDCEPSARAARLVKRVSGAT